MPKRRSRSSKPARRPLPPGAASSRSAARARTTCRDLDLDLPLGELIVVTGVSGSGKSSLAFDTVYAEGQRRYVETFSPYARQFLDRMDKPQVDRIDGIPPAIAIDQTNPVRTSRSTVGTMTELADHLKLLYARAAQLYCRRCGERVRRTARRRCCAPSRSRLAAETRLVITFPRARAGELLGGRGARRCCTRQGYTRIHRQDGNLLEVVQDRVRLEPGRTRPDRRGPGEGVSARARPAHVSTRCRATAPGAPLPFSADLHCAACDIHYHDVSPGSFSFNSPVGACETCRGFGRTMGIDYGLVIPDTERSLADGAVKPFQSQSYHECQDDLLRFARRRGVPTHLALARADGAATRWVIDGEGRMSEGKWYGVRRFFDWLETSAYKMHVRVLLSRYRAYTQCASCHGARLKPESLLWRLGTLRGCRGRARRREIQTRRHGVPGRRDPRSASRPLPARRDAAADRALPRLPRAPAPAGAARRGHGARAARRSAAASVTW